MPYTHFFSDIDGTLLNADRKVSEGLKSQVNQLTEKGHPFILISSRMPAAMMHLQIDLGIADLPLIAYNGGLVIADEKIIHSCSIPMAMIKAVAKLNATGSFSVQLFNADEWYVESMDFYAKREENNTRVSPTVKPIVDVMSDWTKRGLGAHKIMCMGEPEEMDRVMAVMGDRFGDTLHLYRSKDTYIEMANKDISKLTGIRMLLEAKYPEATLENCVAFGDNYNDVEMLEAVGLGVAVANAKAEVLAVADKVTAGNKADGVAIALGEIV